MKPPAIGQFVPLQKINADEIYLVKVMSYSPYSESKYLAT